MAAGCAKVFKEKVSGAKTDRPELAKLIRRLEPADVLVVTRLDRLARSTREGVRKYRAPKIPKGTVLIAPCAVCFRDGDRRARPRSFGGNE
jgi:hypothetical protein